MLADFPFDENVFLMTRYPSEPADHLYPIFESIRQALSKHGLHLHLASDRQFGDDIWSNVSAYMWACKYGIGLLEARRNSNDPNPNVLIELGGMLKTGRRCAILKDQSIPRPPTDLVGFIYKSVNLSRPADVGEAIHRWAGNDLGLGSCGDACTVS
jgi:hypothetical protein